MKLQNKPKILSDKESTDASSQESVHQISFEEQSDSDIVKDQGIVESQEGIMAHYFEDQEEGKDVDKAEASSMKNGSILVQESCTAPLYISTDEEKNLSNPLDAFTAEGLRNVRCVGGVPENTSIITATRISRRTSILEVRISPRPSEKKESGSSNKEAATELEDNMMSAVNESMRRKFSFEQEDETDQTFTEVKNSVVGNPEVVPTGARESLEDEGSN